MNSPDPTLYEHGPNVKPRRSALFMPGNNARALDKARNLPADCLIMDLEDAVAPSGKQQAREQIRHALLSGGYGRRELIVRINSLNSPWGHADLTSVAELPIDAVLLPKVEQSDEIRQARELLLAHGDTAELALWIMIETPRGVVNAESLCRQQAGLDCVVMGTSDLARDLRLAPSVDRTGLQHALAHCVLVARMYELEILDGVHLDLNDSAGLEQSCRQARELGFDGKTLIHPKQVEIANRIFAPDAEQIRLASAIINAWQEASANGMGVCVVEGQLIEHLHVSEAQRLLDLGEAIARQGQSP